MNPFLAALLTFLSGFVALSYELLWYRAISFVSGSSPAAFGLLLGFYLLGLALGSLGCRRYTSPSSTEIGDRQVLALAGFVIVANIAGFLVVPLTAFAATWNLGIGSFPIGWGASLPLVVVAAGMMGAILPLVSHLGIRPDQDVGRLLSYLYLSNILGSCLGTLLTGLVLMDTMSIGRIALLIGWCGIGLAAVLFLASGVDKAAKVRWIGATVLLCVAAAWVTPRLFDRLYDRLLYWDDFGTMPPLTQVVENRHGVVAIAADGTVYGGGMYDGDTSIDLVDDTNWLVRALAIPAIHPAPKQILQIGVATGAWTQVLAGLPGVEHITAVEINPGYLGLIAGYPHLAPILGNPMVDIVVDDARRWMARHPNRKFDAIVMNTSWSWRANSTNLLSLEFMNLAKSRLNPGGMLYFNTTFSEASMRTGYEAFPHSLRVLNFFAGSNQPIRFDSAAWRKALLSTRVNGRLVLDTTDARARARVATLLTWATPAADSAAAFAISTREAWYPRVEHARIITDDNMASEWVNSRRMVFARPPDNPRPNEQH